ncbi:hypothetical protein AVEN_130647-1 [Araneus ventricosus]|nr:hypothetical protein AVEN_136689-1 [Araneus ventricosus]GBN94922.1 hypothetical protein AVEN_130647-1 [Araneus ventricosus]
MLTEREVQTFSPGFDECTSKQTVSSVVSQEEKTIPKNSSSPRPSAQFFETRLFCDGYQPGPPTHGIFSKWSRRVPGTGLFDFRRLSGDNFNDKV